MKTFTFAFFLCLSQFCFGQRAFGHLSFLTDINQSGIWYPEYGARMGLGFRFPNGGQLPLYLELQTNVDITQSRQNTHLNNIQFDVADGAENTMGFARAEFRKFSYSVDMNFGYRTSEFSVFMPYVSVGPRFEQYHYKVHYELYDVDSCGCTYPTSQKQPSTPAIGFNSAAGLKILFLNIGFDFRVGYYGSWNFSTNADRSIPVSASFEIDNYGNPTFDRSGNRFNSGFTFSAGIIFKLNYDSGSDYPYYYQESIGNNNNYEENDFFQSEENNSSESEESTGGSGCEPIKLTPSGRGGGGE